MAGFSQASLPAAEDGADGDGSGDGADRDGADGDSADGDGADGDGAGADRDGADGDGSGDGADRDGADGDSADGDGAGGDGADGDGADGDSTSRPIQWSNSLVPIVVQIEFSSPQAFRRSLDQLRHRLPSQCSVVPFPPIPGLEDQTGIVTIPVPLDVGELHRLLHGADEDLRQSFMDGMLSSTEKMIKRILEQEDIQFDYVQARVVLRVCDDCADEDDAADGEAGEDGADGADGQDGDEGADGEDGADGQDGDEGADDGAEGEDGEIHLSAID